MILRTTRPFSGSSARKAPPTTRSHWQSRPKSKPIWLLAGTWFLSGSEIAWDLGRIGAAAGDQTFIEDWLFVQPFANNTTDDDAGTYAATGVAASIFDGISLTFSNGSSDNRYDVDFPDLTRPATGATTVLTYTGGTGNGQPRRHRL
ncbi:MAG: hypothetical protein HC888_14210 [Candidatus Competibacteraceae bacterium]|nr:hypothetical protein [Candidatus Competibacteraceae bacterium]